MKSLEIAVLMIFHPGDAFYELKKHRDQISYLPGIALLLLVLLSRLGQIFLVHYPLAAIDPTEANLGSELFVMVTPLISWTISLFLVTSIFDGKVKFKESFLAAVYSMIPYILLIIPISLFSQLLSSSEIGLYNLFVNMVWFWIGINFIIHVGKLNEYGFFQSLGVILLTILGVFLLWAVVGIGFTLTNQFFEFVKDVILEISIRIAR